MGGGGEFPCSEVWEIRAPHMHDRVFMVKKKRLRPIFPKIRLPLSAQIGNWNTFITSHLLALLTAGIHCSFLLQCWSHSFRRRTVESLDHYRAHRHSRGLRGSSLFLSVSVAPFLFSSYSRYETRPQAAVVKGQAVTRNCGMKARALSPRAPSNRISADRVTFSIRSTTNPIKRLLRIPPSRKSCTFLAEYKSGVKDKTVELQAEPAQRVPRILLLSRLSTRESLFIRYFSVLQRPSFFTFFPRCFQPANT